MRDQHRRIRPLVAALTSVVVVTGGLALAGPAAAADDIDLAFDFGGPASPIADGWIGVNPGTTYSADAGYGFTVAPASNGFRDRGGDDAMKGDFTISANQSFAVDVPDGTYEVTVWAGDLIAGNTTSLDVEGTAYAGPRTNSGVINEKYFPAIEVTDGQLNVTVTGGDGRINGLTVQTPLAAPTALHAAVAASVPAVDLSWDAAADATGYAVYRADGDDLTEIGRTTGELAFRDTDVEIGESYDYAVATVKGARVSQPSERLTVDVIDASVAKPVVPTGVAASTVERNSITLTWDDAGDARQWKVYRSTRADIAYDLVGTVSAPTFTDDDVLTTRPYLYRIAAVNDGGVSERSAVFSTPVATTLVRQVEYLDRAPVAVKVDDGVYLSWRLLGLDDRKLGFNVYRDGVRVNDKPITDSTNLLDAGGTADSTYFVTALVDGAEVPATDEFAVHPDQFFDIPLDKPADDVLPDGQTVTYAPGDASVGDLDGDGQYELVFLWSPSISKDNSQSGYTGKVYMDAVELDGTKLWRIDLGVNIRAGAHYTQFVVFDLDGDGKAEVLFKTADGTVDGTGTVIGDKDADYRNASGYILDGPEYLTAFDGRTGAAIDTVDYDPGRGDVSAWGDSYGNRVDRFLAGVGYFDGEHPSAVFSRGYYTRTVITTWDLIDGKLVERWKFDSNDAGKQYEGQGNHQLVTADVDRDGLDEIVFGSMTIDDDGTPLYNTKLGHGDALHVGDFVTDRPGLEVFAVHEDVSGNGGIGATMRDAETGEVIWQTAATDDTGRGVAGDIDPTSPGAEAWNVGGNVWNSPTGSLKSEHGELLSTSIPAANFVINWDGDLSQEIFDHDYDEASAAGVPTISEWNPATQSSDQLLRMDGTLTNNTTKGNPSLQADLLGDWREEVVVRTDDGNALRVYTTTDVTDQRIPTLMHDSQYRQSVASQNSAYNQPPHTSYYLGAGMDEVPAASIAYTNAPSSAVAAAPSAATLSNTSGWASGLHDGTYDVDMNLWWGTPGSLFRLYENGALVATRLLDASGTSQSATVSFNGKKNGTYVYTGELVNAKGVTKTGSTTVKVTDAAPGKVVVSHDNWDGDGSFTATADLWWGTNATSYRFELDGEVVGSGDLVAASPNGQRASVSLTGVSRGTHTIVAVFANAAGETTSAPVTVKVTK
ncbi:chitinase N-terminal domain-containing protein [Microbacterium protaetiae]|uniref:rhamnogalacturonan lyase family protein n=1 Tax=Microbacterium protaetiae TaxID=2509458 RepID=UPI001A928082|nr:chitinase N-terminal domain-containing protein [Microbacterium protaetiae]